jgi:hypothetical protein
MNRMSSWFRIVGHNYTAELRSLTQQIRAHMEDTALGRRPISNLRPFLFVQPPMMTCLQRSLNHAVDTVAATAIRTNTPFLMSAWAKYEANEKDRQMILTRIWIRPRSYDSLYWFVATECTYEERVRHLLENPTYPHHASLGPLSRDPRRN